jgi:DNA mismatch repair ATPase MutS
MCLQYQLFKMNKSQLKERYIIAEENFKMLGIKEDRLILILSVLRLSSFIGGIYLIWLGFSISSIAGILVIFTVLTLFLFLLKLYSIHSEKKVFLGNLALINKNEANAFLGDISAFDAGISYIDKDHDFSNDVDIFGISSLFQYLNRTITGSGSDILAGWLSDPYILTQELKSRQEAIKELATKETWRHEFLASGIKKSLDKENISGILEWMIETPVIRSSALNRFLIYLLPSFAIISLMLVAAGVLHYSFFTFIFLFNLLYTAIGLKKINKIHNSVSRKYLYLSSIEKLLKVFENEEFTSSVLTEIKTNISGRDVSAAVSVKKLSRLIQAFDTRMNVLVSFVLNGMFLWDYHSIEKLEKWKSEYKDHFPVWMGMLGMIDAFISLGNYAFNNPGFVYPVLSESKSVFSAKNLGHPLIEEEKRVCNDFTLENRGMICIISGANMAGKSTFLRTIAVNYILGMAGAPVCAGEMEFIPMKLFTSMRTTDSLSHNESYFYAELKRLKQLKSGIEAGEPIFFVLDEILKGTNSTDKSLGSKLFLERIALMGGSGLIATHDTSLGEMENTHPGVIINRCFEIEIKGEIIIFDYKLQPGITHKMNAAFLMKQMGILD